MWGAENWFRMFDDRTIGYDGKLSYMMEWMAKVAGIQKSIPAEDWAK